ncbi:hypothetical protein N9W69_02470 [Flavobacteriaceae bacterium]|nr:hypothetical protein [Flavobacteriaceae bacterium]
MKKVFTIISVILVTASILTSCGRVKTSNTVGDWYHEISRNMGGYYISSRTKLTIIRIEAGVYEYKLATTLTDEMYGGYPKTEYSSGKFEEYIRDSKWVFSGGDFGNRGGYIEVPTDQWDDYNPSKLTIHFESGRGNSMTFTRN